MADLKTESKFDQVKGKIRETAGKLTGKRGTETKGKAGQV